MTIVNEKQRHMLHALVTKGPMTVKQLSELCKNAFGWSGPVFRRTLISLTKQGFIILQDDRLTPTVTRQDLEDNDWDQWVNGSSEWIPQPQTQPKPAPKAPVYRNIWFWGTWIALLAIAIICALFLVNRPTPEEEKPFPEELQVCREALDKWQANKIYYMEHVTQYQIEPSVGNEPLIYNWYYVHETDWMSLSADWNNPGFDSYYSYMYRNGQLLCAMNLKNKYWVDITHSSAFGPASDYAPKPWPMTFNWENCELYPRTTVRYNYGSIVRFLLIEYSGEIPMVYEVEFGLDNFNNIYYVQLITIEDGKKVRLESFSLKTTDPDVIAEAIANQGNAEFDTSEPVPEPG